MAMKIKIEGYEVEGEANEIAALLKELRGHGKLDEQSGNGLNKANHSELSPEFVIRALTRRPLSPSQRKLFKMLLAKDRFWLPSSEIMRKMNLNGNAFGGLFGALGRRMSSTEGYKEGFTLFEWQWDEEREEHDCRFHPIALEVVREMDL